MEAREYRIDNFIVLELKGYVDELNTAILRDEIHTIINTGRNRIALDFTLAEFVSAHCLAAIWRCQQRAHKYGGDIVLFGARARVAETIRFVQLDRVMTVAADLDEVRLFYQTHTEAKAHGHSQDQDSLTTPAGDGPIQRWRQALSRFFQLGLVAATLFMTHPERVLAAGEQAQPLTRQNLRQLIARQGVMARFSDLKRQERLQDREIARSMQLPTMLLTTGYLYQTNPNLLTQVANRELNQLRQQGSESEFSEFKSNTNFRIDKDVVVVSVGMVQVLYSGGLYNAQLRLADARLDEENAKAMVDAGVALETADKLYWGIVLGERKVQLLEARQQAAAEQRAAKEQSLAARAISRAEAAEAELAALAAEQSLLEAHQELTKAKETLSALLARPPQDELRLANEEPSRLKVIHDPDDYLKIAENRYAELSYAAARMDSARAYESTVAASAVRSPKAFALGAVDHTRGLGDSADIVNWTLGVALTMPLYDGGRSFAELEKSRLLLAQARLGYEEARSKLQLGLREAVSGIRAADIKLTIAEKGRKLALERGAAAAAAAEKGQIPHYRANLARQAELEAGTAVVTAQAEYARWRSRLVSLTGEDL